MLSAAGESHVYPLNEILSCKCCVCVWVWGRCCWPLCVAPGASIYRSPLSFVGSSSWVGVPCVTARVELCWVIHAAWNTHTQTHAQSLMCKLWKCWIHKSTCQYLNTLTLWNAISKLCSFKLLTQISACTSQVYEMHILHTCCVRYSGSTAMNCAVIFICS